MALFDRKGKPKGTFSSGSSTTVLIRSCVEKLLFLEETSIRVSQEIAMNKSLWAPGYRGSGLIRCSGGGVNRGYV